MKAMPANLSAMEFQRAPHPTMRAPITPATRPNSPSVSAFIDRLPPPVFFSRATEYPSQRQDP
jgi:hypothetical protein